MQDWDLHRLRGLAGWLTGLLLCSGGGIGRRARLRIWWNNNPCGFESLPEHHMEALWAGLDSNQRRHKSQRIYSPPRLAASVPTQTEKLQDPQIDGRGLQLQPASLDQPNGTTTRDEGLSFFIGDQG